MQPVALHKEVSSRSQLLDSLKVYLNNKNRLQPIIGLGSIIECVETGSHKREALYLCEVCVCRLSKADIRNHIMGSLHRYKYIKDFHPDLVSEWKENFDLSKLAWPLMEKAKGLEKKEGPGHVKSLEVEGAAYEAIATCGENDAVALISILRDRLHEGHWEATSVQLEREPVQSQRIVLLSQNRQRQTENPHQTSASTRDPPSPNSTPASPLDCIQMAPEPSVLTENSNSFLHGYTGVKPLIGLLRVVECRGEDGHTYCFLCHCCRIRSNKRDIIDHLTGSSHLVNYLMETRPELAGLMTADVNGEPLRSLAGKVEQEEGRGELKVINAPESLCVLLTGKSYHWCIKVLCNEQTVANFQKGKIAVRGPHVKKISNRDMPRRCELRTDCPGRARAKRRKRRKVSSTVFKVSLPIRKGAVLLERTSFTVDSEAVSSTADSPPSDADLSPSPEPRSEGREPGCDDSGSFTVNHTENASAPATSRQDLHGGHAEPAQYTAPGGGFVTHYQPVDGCLSDGAYYNQPEYASGTENQRFYWENNGQPGFQHGSSEKVYATWQNEGPPPASHAQDWATYNSPYGHEEQWHNSASQTVVVENGQNQMRAEAAQFYAQQHPQNLYLAQDHTSPLTGIALHGDLAPRFDPARINAYPNFADYPAHSGDGVVRENEQRGWQLYTQFSVGQFQTAQPYYPTPPMAYQAIPTPNYSYNIGPTANLDWH